jgi:kumamolisin
MSASERVPIQGSERSLVPAHDRVGDLDDAEAVDVTVYLRARSAPDWVDAEAQRPPAERRRLDREAWAAQHGADAADMDRVSEWARGAGLQVTHSDPARRALTLRGPLSSVAAAFGAQLEGRYRTGDGVLYRARTGPITIPARLSGVITGVFGIDDRPQARAHLKRLAPADSPAALSAPQVAQAYDFPPNTTGSGQTIAILELGGGYSTADLGAYFSGLGIAEPSVTAVGVDGGQNNPGVDAGADGEVMLDIEVAGAVAPGAKIVVYFVPNTDQGFLDGLSTAVHDTAHTVSIVSISWGGPEESWSAQGRQQMEQILVEAAALGVTVTAAAGDSGSTDGVADGKQHVDVPASAPHALACGGTRLELSGSAISSETVWNDSPTSATGGGVSVAFTPAPSYQSTAHVPVNVDTHGSGRGVPDVAGNADPQSGYQVLVSGQPQVIGGTSAVAPLWAGLTARLNEQLGAPIGFAQPRLYPLQGTAAFNDITQGSNGAYSAGPGWDACSGLGSPNGAALAAGLAGGAAGVPGRASG